jgi:hypothetical protein
LELVFRHDKQNDEPHRRIVERVEINALLRAAKGGNDALYTVRGSMRDGDAESNSRAHRLLAIAEGGQNRLAIRLLDVASAHKQIDDLDYGGPSIAGRHLRDDLVNSKKIPQSHDWRQRRWRM